jgi:hypothetical protein
VRSVWHMADWKRARPLFSRQAIPGWVLAFFKPANDLISGISNADWVRNNIPTPVWPFIVAHGDWVAFALGMMWLTLLVVRPWHQTEAANTSESVSESPPWSDTLEIVAYKTFTNETVELDGKQFNKCNFVNVIWRYVGKGPVAFFDCGTIQQVTLVTESSAMLQFLALAKIIEAGSGGIRIMQKDGAGNLHEVETRIVRPKQQKKVDPKQTSDGSSQ